MSDLGLVTGWGGNPRARTHLVTAETIEDLTAAIAGQKGNTRGLIARGLGRSYGDAAQRSGGTTVEICLTGEPEWVDHAGGLLRAPSGLSIGDLIRFADSAGLFVPVTPGTRHVTVGGAIAADIHGKDHHAVGSFGMHVERFRMIIANGDFVEVDLALDPDLFHATIGGMGLTGLIVDADIRMSSVSGNRVAVDTLRTKDLEATLAALAESESSHRYSVAWIDLSRTGAAMGRGVVTNGNHVETEFDGEPLREPKASVPRIWRLNVVNKATVSAFNEMWFRKAPRRPRRSVQSYDSFFYPLDAVGDWNRVYGRNGFLQYQFVLPFESAGHLPGLAESLATGPTPASFAVLKGLGHGSGGFLSFPTPGWTLAVDIPIPSTPSVLEQHLRKVDEALVEAGGRIYLAKDSRLRADLITAMYPQLDMFEKVRRNVDPDQMFRSDLSVRLGI